MMATFTVMLCDYLIRLLTAWLASQQYVWSLSLRTCAVGTPLSNAVASQKQHAVSNNMASQSVMVEWMEVWDQYVELKIRMQVVLTRCNYSYLEIR